MKQLLLSVVLSLFARDAWACAVCGCGDPTLTVMGNEQPYPHRVRAGVTAMARWDRVGRPGVDDMSLSEQRFDVTAVYAPWTKLLLSVVIPTLFRQVTDASLARTATIGLGDLEARAKWFAWSDGMRQQLAFTTGLKLPTAQVLRGADGKLLPIEVQSGTGSFDPSLALNYSWTNFPYAFFASATVIVPTVGVAGFRSSPSLRTSLTGQYEFLDGWVIRVSLDTRADLKAYEGALASRDSGGFVAYFSPDLMWQPVQDLVVMVGTRLPFVQALAGYHREGVILASTVAYDFN